VRRQGGRRRGGRRYADRGVDAERRTTADRTPHDPAEGIQRWHYAASTPNVIGVAAAEDAAYITGDCVLRVLDAATGRKRWSTSPNSEAGYRGVPAVGE